MQHEDPIGAKPIYLQIVRPDLLWQVLAVGDVDIASRRTIHVSQVTTAAGVICDYAQRRKV